MGRSALFLATALAIPFYAFPILTVAGRPIDAATLFAAVFLLVSLPSLLRLLREDRARALFAAAAVAVPLLVLLAPRHPTFSPAAFAVSLAHWLLVAGFFLAAATLTLDAGERRRFLGANLVVGIAVAGFALYQAFGHARGWPGAGERLLLNQRAPFRMLGYGDYPRPTSFFLEPSYLGGYLTWIALLALAAAASRERRDSPALPIAAFSLAVLGVAMSLSWGAYADLAAVVLVALILARRLPRETRTRLRPFAAVFAVAILTAAVTPLTGAFVERVRRLSRTPLDRSAPAVLHADSAGVRVENLRYIVGLFRSEPLTGIGLGQFQIRGAARTGSPRESPWCGWAAAAALFGVLGPALVAAGLLLLLRDSAWRPGLLAAGTVALAVVDQVHTASFIDLRWWLPLAAVVALSGPGSRAAGRSSGSVPVPP